MLYQWMTTNHIGFYKVCHTCILEIWHVKKFCKENFFSYRPTPKIPGMLHETTIFFCPALENVRAAWYWKASWFNYYPRVLFLYPQFWKMLTMITQEFCSYIHNFERCWPVSQCVIATVHTTSFARTYALFRLLSHSDPCNSVSQSQRHYTPRVYLQW